MSIKHRQAALRILYKSITIALCAFMFWAGVAFAETKTNLYVNPYGNIGIAYTQGSFPNYSAKTSTTGLSIYYIEVNFRKWHGYLEWEVIKNAYNSNQTPVASIGSGTWGAFVARHTFNTGGNQNIYYTSGSGTNSTYNAWNTGSN